MSIISIHCRLTASESTRHQIWDLMTEKNTPLINELLRRLSEHEDFEQWCKQGWLKAGLIKKLGDELRQDSRFQGQPGRFYTSAVSHVEDIYKSFLKRQRQLRLRLQGQERWLQMLKSDQELAQAAEVSLDDIRRVAQDIIDRYPSEEDNLSQKLFDAYGVAEDILTKSAICFLIKNGCRVPKKEEDSAKFKKRCRKAEIKAERLRVQIESRRPLGRDLTNDRWINTLLTAASTEPQDDSEAMAWQNQLLQQHSAVPYPVAFGNEDLFWSKDSNGRLCIKFNGLGSHTFKIYCDQRQLKWLERFYQDREVKRHSKENGKDKHTSALFTLRSGMLAWQEQQGKEEPWQKNRLTLSCSLDTRFWSAEGTEIIRQQKAIEVKEILAKMEDKADLTRKQEAFVSKKQSTLDRLNNPFPRPHQSLYCGQANLLLSVSMTLEKPATVAIVNTLTGKAITYRSFKQLLGDEYHLFNRQRKQKQHLSHLRKNAQRKHQIIHAAESELGQYIDRLVAKSIVELAMEYQAGSIVLPALTNIREIVESEIKVRAEAKIPGCIEAQKQYAKEYRISIHRWSYARLKDSIQAQASQHNIPVEIVKQPILIEPVEIAEEMSKIAYEKRCVP
jgi:IS605 OrfB family transposase